MQLPRRARFTSLSRSVLEKLVAGDVVDLTLKMREPVESLPAPSGQSGPVFPGYMIPSMWLLTGEIVTELEAINNRLPVQRRGCQRRGGRILDRYQGDPRSSEKGHGFDSLDPGETALHAIGNDRRTRKPPKNDPAFWGACSLEQGFPGNRAALKNIDRRNPGVRGGTSLWGRSMPEIRQAK